MRKSPYEPIGLASALETEVRDMRAVLRYAQDARREAEADLAALRERHQRANTCVVCQASLMPSTEPPHCEGCHPTDDDILDAEQEGTPKAKEPQHVCGLSGYNGMIDPPCQGCEARIHGNDAEQEAS